MDGQVRILIGIAALVAAFQTHAGTVIYEFTGVVPPGASSHSEVQDGESWTVTVEVDDSVTDIDATPQRGSYLFSVLSSSITFSGGYSQVQTQPETRTVIYNDRFNELPEVYFDGVSVRRLSDESGLQVQVVVEQLTAPVPLLADDGLIGPGLSFSQSPSLIGYVQLVFADEQLPGQFVSYSSLDAANTMFSSFAPVVDTDGDGVGDDTDNCTLLSNPTQFDNDGDGHGNRCDADFNNDCVVNPIDLGFFKSVFFTANGNADLDGNGTVNAVDLGIFRSLFFLAPGPSASPSLCGT